MTSIENLIPETTTSPVALASSSNGRTSGKPWKSRKSATVRSHIPNGVKAKSWQDRMEKTKKETAIKKLQTELKDEKRAEITRRRQVTLDRKKSRRGTTETRGREGQDGTKESCKITAEGRPEQKDQWLKAMIVFLFNCGIMGQVWFN